jgi:hypothetical protein
MEQSKLIESKTGRFDIILEQAKSMKEKKEKVKTYFNQDKMNKFKEDKSQYQPKPKNMFEVLEEGEATNVEKPSRFSILKTDPNDRLKKEVKTSDNVDESHRFSKLQSSNLRPRRNMGVFDKISERQNEEREERIERNSHIKFRNNNNTASEFEMYNSKKYQRAVDINSVEAFPSLEVQVKAPTVAPVNKWASLVGKKDDNKV